MITEYQQHALARKALVAAELRLVTDVQSEAKPEVK